MSKVKDLINLVNKFDKNRSAYKNDTYNEHSCRDEFINPLLEILGWDISNKSGLAPQYREVIAEYYASSSDRPDYSLTLRGVAKFFVEAKKPSVDISKEQSSAIQARKYGWNANHKIAILTNFEYFIIYDTTYIPKASDSCDVAVYRKYHYTEYVDRLDEILSLVSRESVYSGNFDKHFNEAFKSADSQKRQVDYQFLSQINGWRVALSNELFAQGGKYASLDVLNDVVQEFINQIVFLRICEDKNLPLYHHLKDTISDTKLLHKQLEKLFREADKRYNSGMFSGNYIIFDINSKVITDMIQGLYYPQSPYLFSIIEPNMLGKIYEMFLTEQLTVLDNGTIGLAHKKDCINRSVVTTPTEIVKCMVEKALSQLCKDKVPSEIYNLRIADISCGSGVFLEEAFQYLQSYCVEWYLKHDKGHLIEIGDSRYKLPLDEKKRILCSCIYGIDIDVHATEVAKFSLLIKLIENETAPSVQATMPILPDLDNNIFHGNALVGGAELKGINCSEMDLINIVPFDWEEMGVESFDAIIGNPPYVTTEDIHLIMPEPEFDIYKRKYRTSHKQFDKYYIFLERALQKVKESGYICYIIPNKFFKIGSGEKLRQLVANNKYLVSLDDFGATQLFEDKTVYSSIVLLKKEAQNEFVYSSVDSINKLWLGEPVGSITLDASIIDKQPWKLTSDFETLQILNKIQGVSVPLAKCAEIFNGIQTSAERPMPIYWFSGDEIIDEDSRTITVKKCNKTYHIEKSILKPYFKPTKKIEKGLTTYDTLGTDKRIIFPYDNNGHLIPIETMKTNYSGAYEYLLDNYDRLVPKCVSKKGTRDVPNATADTWYQYGRTQALTSFINTPKLIVKVMANESPMYALDKDDMLISSGGTAGYCAISAKQNTLYELEYIQAWLANPYTERIFDVLGSDFEGGFVSRGTFVLSAIPFVELDFLDKRQKAIYDRVVEASQEIYKINDTLLTCLSKQTKTTLKRKKSSLIKEVEELIARVYRLEF